MIKLDKQALFDLLLDEELLVLGILDFKSYLDSKILSALPFRKSIAYRYLHHLQRKAFQSMTVLLVHGFKSLSRYILKYVGLLFIHLTTTCQNKDENKGQTQIFHNCNENVSKFFQLKPLVH